MANKQVCIGIRSEYSLTLIIFENSISLVLHVLRRLVILRDR